MKEHVALFLAEGFEEIEALTPVDVLRRADIKVTTVSISNSLEVTGSHQITIKADTTFNQMDFSDVSTLVLPGGMPGSKNLQKHTKLNELLIQFAKKGRLIGALCAAPIVPGSLGLLKKTKVTCYPGFEQHLIEAEYSNELTTYDGNFITGKAAGASMRFSLQLVEIICGKEKAEEIASAMYVEN